MVNLREKYAFSKKLAKNGAKLFVGDGEDEYLLVRRFPNRNYREDLTKSFQANAERLEALEGEAKEALDLKLQAEVEGRTILVGWGKGVDFGDGYKKYTAEYAATQLEDLTDLREEVRMFAVDRSNFPAEADLDVEHAKK
jgi:hypothetical protein